MRPLFSILVLSLLAAGWPPSGHAQTVGNASFDSPAPNGSTQIQTCAVTSIDSVAMNFSCGDEKGSTRYWVTRGSQFYGQVPGASLFDLFPGQAVKVTSHHFGSQEIADIVAF
jgi:hypothetical protein